MSDIKVKLFVTDLRRILYLMQVLKYNIDGLKASDVAPSFMKQDGNNILNAINRFLGDCMCKTTPETWDAVKRDLSSEELQDIGLLIDTMSDVKNVGEITAILQEHKTAA